MSEKFVNIIPAKPKSQAESLRDQRLKAALKANMARRKAQARGRADQDSADSSSDNNENE